MDLPEVEIRAALDRCLLDDAEMDALRTSEAVCASCSSGLNSARMCSVFFDLSSMSTPVRLYAVDIHLDRVTNVKIQDGQNKRN